MPLFNNADSLLDTLNEEQSQAVTTTDGPLLIIAGAGTGKTSVVTRRIAYIINKGLARPEEILALTFTDKACEEMRDRLDRLLPYGQSGTDIFTFHSFGETLIRENAISLGLSPEYTLMTKAEEIYFFRQHLFLFPLDYFRPMGNPTKFIDDLIGYFSKLMDEDIDESQYSKYILSLENFLNEEKDPKQIAILKENLKIHTELLACFKVYQETKLKEGYLNFADLIYLSLNALRDHPTILDYYQKKYKYVLVDEFQDTNYTQNEIVKLISGKYNNICVCGDDDQSIYRFRGASISNIMSFFKDHPDAKQVVLTKNYRSNQSILDAAYTVISKNNPNRLEIASNINKKLIAEGNSKNYPVKVFGLSTVTKQLEYMAEEIERIREEDPSIEYKDIAILIRSNSQSESVLRELTIRDIPAIFQGTSGLYETKEIRPILSLIYALARFDDNINLFNLASSNFYNIPMPSLIACNALARSIHKPLSYVFSKAHEIEELTIPEEDKESIYAISQELDSYREISREQNVGSVLLSYLKDKGYMDLLETQKTEDRIENIQKFFQRIDRFLQTGGGSIEAFCEYLDYTREIGDDPLVDETDSQIDAVNILTIHKAKGLEYKAVFLIDLIEGRFPSRNMRDPIEIPEEMVKETLPSGDFHVQEERRLFYVAMTRAKERLYLLWANDYFQKTKKRPSIFIIETEIQPTQISSRDGDIEKKNPEERVEDESNFDKDFEITEPITLTQSSIEDYTTCPKKYEYKHVLKVQVPQTPQTAYGSIIHSIIQQILKRKLNEGITEEEIDNMLSEEWKSSYFLSDEHSDILYKKAKESLHDFFLNYSKESKYIEKKFSIEIAKKLFLEGRWDLITTEEEIVDFKTGLVGSEKEAIKKAKESDQLKIYALAYFRTFHHLPKILTLHFVSSGISGSIKPTDKMLDEALKIVIETGNNIAHKNYEAKPSYMACSFCEFKNICQYTMAD